MTIVEPGSDNQIILSRIFNAPRALVWKAFTDPAQIPQWWGPQGFTTKTQVMDVRPGGTWRFVFHGPDGREYKNLVSYTKVVEPSLLAYTHGDGSDNTLEPVNHTVIVTFEEVTPNQTKVTLHSTFVSKEARDFVVKEYGAIEGGKQTLGRLAEFVESSAAPSTHKPFVVSRVLKATPELVFKVWTDPAHLAQWFGPKGCPIGSSKLDLRVGGMYHYSMTLPNGDVWWGRWVFREITPPGKLVFVQSFSDPNAGVTRAPFNPNWPLETLSTVTFLPHAGVGRGTVVTLEGIPINATQEEQDAFAAFHGSMTQGWSGTFDQLAEHLTKP